MSTHDNKKEKIFRVKIRLSRLRKYVKKTLFSSKQMIFKIDNIIPTIEILKNELKSYINDDIKKRKKKLQIKIKIEEVLIDDGISLIPLFSRKRNINKRNRIIPTMDIIKEQFQVFLDSIITNGK